jgi:signal transduction histidine kinase
MWVNDQDELLEMVPSRREAARKVGLRASGALPIRFGQEVIGVMELFSDQAHPSNKDFSDLMDDVSAQIGKVLERERMSAQMADLVWREQQGLLHTLHDSLGQTLTGLGMLSAGLSQRLAHADAAAADTAQQIAHQTQHAIEQVRQLAKGMFPVEVDADGLMSALRQLAVTTQSLHQVDVHVEGSMPASLRDGAAATQMYRIAQEAVTNAVKHAQARTITIHINSEAGLTTLRVIDDGVGIQNTEHKHDGVGLGIMKHRAASIGGNLTIAPGPDVGTVVTCTVRGVARLIAPYRG